MIWHDLTPFFFASKAANNFGVMPPIIILSLISFLPLLADIFEIIFLLSSKIPFISVRRISFSAFKLSATFPATTSALIFRKLPSLFTPIGAITGIDPEDIVFFNSETRILSTLPTNLNPGYQNLNILKL